MFRPSWHSTKRRQAATPNGRRISIATLWLANAMSTSGRMVSMATSSSPLDASLDETLLSFFSLLPVLGDPVLEPGCFVLRSTWQAPLRYSPQRTDQTRQCVSYSRVSTGNRAESSKGSTMEILRWCFSRGGPSRRSGQ
jgi:hypothetical protein